MSEKEKATKQFAVRVCHSGTDPLGDNIEEGHAFFTLTCHERGKEYQDLAPGEGGCVRRGTTADAFHIERGKKVPILYNVTRVT